MQNNQNQIRREPKNPYDNNKIILVKYLGGNLEMILTNF